MEDNEIEEGGISLGDIFRTIFSQKWLALIVAVAVAVIGVVGLYFMNKPKQEYVVSFVMKLPGSTDSPDSYTYPDGTRFHFTDLMSSKNLQKVKAESQDYADIDVDKMVKNGDISIKRETLEVIADSKIYEINYTLSAKASYFKNSDIARNFMIALTELPAEHLKEMEIDYDTYLSASAKAITYDTQLSYLQNQVNYISSLYNSFIGSYNGSFVVKDGKTLSSYKADIDVFISNNRAAQLKNEALENKYIKDGEKGQAALSEYNSQAFELKRQLEVAENVYNELKALLEKTNPSAVFDNPQILEQQRTIQDLKQKQKDVNGYINEHKFDSSFDESVSALENEIRNFTSEFIDVASIVYSTASTVSFANSTIITTEGGMSIMMSAAISIVAAIIIAAIVAYIVGWSKQKKSAPVKASAPAYFEAAEAQAVVTEDKPEEKEDKE
ncbi:MAG TPA: hypothetical protein DD415_02080 [Clostridiales bacterium]|nr:hypothetical protein [Clostridiales bacterium]